MATAVEARDAFLRLRDPARPVDARLHDELMVARFLDSAAIGERCPNDIAQHWMSVADGHAGHAHQLQAQIRDFRALVRRLIAENEDMESSALRLCDLLASRSCAEDVRDAISEVKAALKGKFTSRRKQDWEEAVPLYAIGRVLEQMFAKMKSSEKLTKAAIEWATKRLKKHCLSVDRYTQLE